MIEIQKLLDLSYEDCCKFFIEKYGPVNGDYFCTPKCASTNKKIKRTKEGLFIHHIDEDKVHLLCNKNQAINYPFEYQKANRLIYCNLLEHLVLHIKIFQKTNGVMSIPGLSTFIIPELIEIYSKSIFIPNWKKPASEKVIEKKECFYYCLKKLREYGYNHSFSIMPPWFKQHDNMYKIIDEINDYLNKN